MRLSFSLSVLKEFMKTKKKPLLIVKRKKGSKWKFPIKDKQTIKPEELFPIIFTGIRRNNKALKDAEKLIGSDLIDDIEFAKVTANKKELVKKYDLEYCSVFEDNENGAEVYA